MAVERLNDWRRPGCGDGCHEVYAFLPGLSGRERLELHDPDAHESYAARDGRPRSMVINTGPLSLDLWTYTATCNGEALALSPGNWTLLRVFGSRPDSYCSLSMLSMAMFGVGVTTNSDKHVVRIAVRRLRRALGAAAYLIETHQGVGYRMRIAPPRTAYTTASSLESEVRRLHVVRHDGARARRQGALCLMPQCRQPAGTGRAAMTPIREISRLPSESRNGRIAGKGDVPPGCVDGFCAVCKRDVIADETDPRCDNCGQPLHPASLPFPPRSASQSAESEPEAVEPTPRPLTPVKARPAAAEARTVTLAPTRAALAWSHATDALVAEAERDEAEAEKAFQQAKARRDQARRQANYARQLRQLVQVDGATDALPAAAKRTAGRLKPDGRWARDWDACRLCGTTAGKHQAKGRCMRCDKHFREYGVEWPNKETVNDGD